MIKVQQQFFIYNTCEQLTLGINEISFYSCYYDINNFHDSLYVHFGITEDNAVSQAVKKRRAEFLAGRICASRALNKIGIQHVNISSHSDRSPIWPNEIVGSITHTKIIAAAVIASKKKISALGIDCEHIMSSQLAKKIRDQIVRNDENPEVYHHTLNLDTFVTLLFSAKESLYKALYPQVKKFMDFHNILVTQIGSQTLTVKLCIDFGDWRKGAEFEIYYQQIDDYILTLAYI